jgi:esterase/lipase
MGDLIKIKEDIILYLSKKGIFLEKNNTYLKWRLDLLDSKYDITLWFDGYSDDIIRYSSSCNIKNLKKRRTALKGKFLYSIYKNLTFIKEKCLEDAKKIKYSNDIKNKYCKELESYYSKLYKKIYIQLNELNNAFNIVVTCYDNSNNYTIYNIIYNNNKYLLTQKQEYKNIVIKN